MIQETHEQQQIYNLFRSCIYIFLILELIVNMPIGIGSSIMQGFIAILGKLEVFGSVVICKVLKIEVSENQISGRTIELNINYKDVLNADCFDD